jgi:very-short-patch-repair endonuclease
MRAKRGVQDAAKRLRREMTPPEVRLWLRLRSEDGPRFRRQHAMGPYVLDFYCPEARLVVEVDGWGHSIGDQPGKDEVRDAWLLARGLTVVRINASDVLADPDAAADGVWRHAADLSGRGGELFSSPAKRGGGREADGGGAEP